MQLAISCYRIHTNKYADYAYHVLDIMVLPIRNSLWNSIIILWSYLQHIVLLLSTYVWTLSYNVNNFCEASYMLQYIFSVILLENIW